MKERAESRKMRMMRFPVEKLRWSSCQTISFPWQTWCQGRLLCKQMSSNDECMQKQISPKERWSSWKWKLIIMKNQKLKGCIAVHAGMLMIMMTVHSRSSPLVWNADSIGIVDFIHYFPFFSFILLRPQTGSAFLNLSSSRFSSKYFFPAKNIKMEMMIESFEQSCNPMLKA